MTPAELADAQDVARQGSATAARILLGVLIQDYLELQDEVATLRWQNLAHAHRIAVQSELLARRAEKCAEEEIHDTPVFTQ